ncbi:MAG: CalY family protein [Patescibacteria group bacterium]|nr:CalY family protein [Patescibacteria group bacterium]
MSMMSIFSVLTLMSGAAYAAFSSTASNNGNTFGAGSISLTINGSSGSGSSPVFNVPGAAPGQIFTQPIILANAGSDASNKTKLVNINHGTGTSPDLGNKLTLQIYDDVDGNGILDGSDPLRGSAHVTDGAWSNIDLGFGLSAGGAHRIFAVITFDSDADNTYQGANSNFNLNFETSQ